MRRRGAEGREEAHDGSVLDTSERTGPWAADGRPRGSRPATVSLLRAIPRRRDPAHGTGGAAGHRGTTTRRPAYSRPARATAPPARAARRRPGAGAGGA